jgi:hypothetical protein
MLYFTHEPKGSYWSKLKASRQAQIQVRRLEYEAKNNSRVEPFMSVSANLQKHNAALKGLRDKRDEFARERDQTRREQDEAVLKGQQVEEELENLKRRSSELGKEAEAAVQRHQLDAQKMLSDIARQRIVSLEQHARGGVASASLAKPGKRGQDEPFEQQDGGDDGREKRHQEKPVWNSGVGDDIDSLFEED